MRIGHGYDVHRLVPDRKLILGGVEIPWEKGLLGHSDADVLTHALMDALLGAAALGDIGKLFPDNDPAYLGGLNTEHRSPVNPFNNNPPAVHLFEGVCAWKDWYGGDVFVCFLYYSFYEFLTYQRSGSVVYGNELCASAHGRNPGQG